MSYKEQFNKPLPSINRDVKNINIETSNSLSGVIVIKNDGGGEIAGRIMSNSQSVIFDPENFFGNDSKITYYINLDYYSPGDVLTTDAIIMSNGGEHIIDFTVKVIPHAIVTTEGIEIVSLSDFYGYSASHPISARQLYVSNEFMMWLYSIGYPYIDAYERFTADANKERALDNFLIFNNLKNKTQILCDDKSKRICGYPYYGKIWTDIIKLKKSDGGYVDCEVRLENGSDWLELSHKRLITSDFDAKYEAEISLFVDSEKLPKKINVQYVIIDGIEICVTVIKARYIEARLEKEYMAHDESSYVIIKNNSGKRLVVDIFPEDEFIKFESVRFLIDEYARIPFHIALTPLQRTQITLFKQAFIETYVNVETALDSRPFLKRLRLLIGGMV